MQLQFHTKSPRGDSADNKNEQQCSPLLMSQMLSQEEQESEHCNAGGITDNCDILKTSSVRSCWEYTGLIPLVFKPKELHVISQSW